MEHIKFNIASKYDNLVLDGIIIKPDNVKAIVQLAHGMCEHKERYIPFMEYLAHHGYLCVMHDHRGHGKSIKENKDLGYFYEGKAEALVEDIQLIHQYIKQQYPNLPFYLFGHSMGSLAVRAYIKKYDDQIDGLFVCGSPSGNPMTGAGLFLVRTLSKIKGAYHKSSFVDNMVIGVFNKPFENEHLQNAWLTTDVNIVKEYNEDPLCGYSFTMNGYESLFSLMKNTYSKDNWQLNNPNLPIYFISGKEDPCKTNDQEFYKSVNLLKEVGYKNASYQLFENMRHEILNEIEKNIVYNDVLNKLNEWTK